ncbi:MAG: sigma-54 dependent transcriptional regulator [bacterium]
MSKILVVDDESSARESICITLQKMGHQLKEAATETEAVTKIKEEIFDLIITDMKMPCEEDGPLDEECGLQVVKRAKEINPSTMVIVITGYGTIENAVNAMKEGAFDYITKPFSIDEIRIRVQKALDQYQIANENKYLREKIKSSFDEMVGNSEGIKKVRDNINEVAATDASVLIRGENGVGKEIVAKLIYENSRRKDNSFIVVNCAAIPETLLESELFGYAPRSGIAGADPKGKPGKFELADRGTIFLDEVGDMSLPLQAKLLRVLENKEFERISGTKPIKVDVRIIAASNKKLEEAISKGEFRVDIFYRLNVYPIYVPPLRERKDDIPSLADYFIKRYEREIPKKFKGISQKAIDLLIEYDWPGNIRELKNIIQRMIIRGKGEYLDVEDVPAEICSFPASLSSRVNTFDEVIDNLIKVYKGNSLWNETLRSLAKRTVEKVGSKNKALEVLGISKPTLLRWVRK